ncbi:MAG: RNA polymerase-binding protein DksA, partial [Alcaligenaceae bacterium]|nr:RNA polymerase-binding protein DksA [Alcaligenaceae bacterium]
MAKATKKTLENLEEQAAALTEEQLLAMSEDDYMNDLQLAFFKNRLR